jgi:capsular polysaccharide biosynthesis protein
LTSAIRLALKSPEDGRGATLIDEAGAFARANGLWVHAAAPALNTPKAVQVTAHSKLRSRFQNVRVFGSHHLHAFVEDGQVLSTQSLDPLKQLRAHVRLHPGRHLPIPQIHLDDTGVTVDYSKAAAPVSIQESVLFTTPTEPMNWGMWLLNVIPALHDFAYFPRSMKILSFLQRPWQEKFLGFFGVEPERVIRQHPWQVYDMPECITYQYSSVDLCARPSDLLAFDWARSLARRALGAEYTNFPRKIFVSRKSFSAAGNGHRQLMNEEALIRRMGAMGYTTIEPETMSLPEQIAVFANAERVVGLGGAAMFNCVFCRPGTPVISIEATTDFATQHANMFASLGLNAGFIFGQSDGTRGAHSPWTLDDEAAARLIRRHHDHRNRDRQKIARSQNNRLPKVQYQRTGQ